MSKTHDEYINEIIDLSGIPSHMRPGVIRYVMNGVVPGDFLLLILQNDFAHAAQVADDINRHHLFQFAALLYHLPVLCWGCEEKVRIWAEHGGLIGPVEDETKMGST